MAFELYKWNKFEDRIMDEVEDWLRESIINFYDVSSLEDLSNEQIDEIVAYLDEMPTYSWVRERLVPMIDNLIPE
jgi:hypothetical protein